MLGFADKNKVYEGEVGGWYVLAGASRVFPLKISQQDCLSMDTLQLTGFIGDDYSEASFEVGKKLCMQVKAEK